MSIVQWFKERKAADEQADHDIAEAYRVANRVSERLGLPHGDGAFEVLARWQAIEALLDRVEALEAKQAQS